MRVFIAAFLAMLLASTNLMAQAFEAKICISKQQAIDIITLLDASDKDLEVLGSCEQLVTELYKTVEERDKRIADLTSNLIQAKQDVLEYKGKVVFWRRVSLYGTAVSVALIVLQVL